MKKKILAILTALMVVFTFSSCGTPISADCASDERFFVVTNNVTNTIYVDRKTGVMYFYHRSGYGGGLTVMLDKDGKPLTWEGNNDD